MPTVAMNPGSIQSTPSRERTQTHRSEASSSPSTVRVTQSASTTSSAAGPSTTPLTVQGLLAANAFAADPSLAALEHAVNDRNTLSSQNSQLWKLIERQRTGYAQLVKEIERVRGERDVYRSRLQSLGESTDALLRTHRERERREGKDALRSTASHAHLRSSESVGSGVGNGSALDPRGNAPRSSQDDISSQRSAGPTLASLNDQTASSRPMGRERQGSQNSLNVPLPTSQLSYNYLSVSQGSSSSQVNLSVSQSSSIPAVSSSNYLPPSITERFSDASKGYQQSANPAGPTRSIYPVSPDQPSVELTTAGSSASAATLHGSPPFNVMPSMSFTQSQLDAHSSLASSHADREYQPQVIVQSASVSGLQVAPLDNDTSQIHSNIEVQDDTRGLAPPVQFHTARESHISLPEETKRYYATMGESPVPSPLSTHEFPHTRSEAQPSEKSSGSSLYQPESSAEQSQISLPEQDTEALPNPFDDPSQTGSRRPAENGGYLEADESDSVYDGVNDSRMASTADLVETEDQLGHEGAVGPNISRKDRKRAAVEDFPLPPTSPPVVPAVDSFAHSQLQQQQIQAMQRVHNDSQTTESTSQTLVTDSSGTVSRSTLEAPGPIAQSQSSQSDLSQASSTSTTVPLSELAAQAPFRALPLLASDLPYTTIEVCNSTIRPNDRGKEVLSFIIAVNPGRGKESWRVEKLYSDVLTLDSRVRASIGKSMGKKLVSLPEGRLWKDHAPAKVDQRKVALEQYLRSLIALPVKNKDEIIAFFTSDILRPTQKPVSQAGYKEGYLTKRGKNFGGWKTRYFVLQGPSLEYYESRGGTHLGSILITGAQIGRQQRSLDKKEADEDNDYRHAFLIIEAKRGPGGSNSRHVLCAESDEERDNWVEVLVRYVSGTYNDEDFTIVQNGTVVQPGIGGRISTSSITEAPTTPTRRLRKEEIAKGTAVPISQLPPDVNNAKLFQGISPPPPDDISVKSPAKTALLTHADQLVQSASEAQTSSSLPVSSPLGVDDPEDLAPIGQRANSEMGHYPDLTEQRAVMKSRPGFVSPEQRRKDKRRSINPLKGSPIPERTPSPDKDFVLQTPRVDAHGKVKISGPMNGTPIPAGYKFGGKDAPSEASSSDRREKAKSRSFWGFGGAKHDKPNAPVHVPRAVFGVSLEESLEIAEIAGLPAIVFRCIQYLEAKKADQEEGIYRLSGSSAVIKALKDRFNNEGDVDLLGSDEYWDPHAIAGLLKNYLRELPASILTRDLHLRFLSVIDFVDPQERITELSQLIASLPVANYSLLRALTAHLILIVQNSHINKMTMRNVGIVFSPTLGIPAGVFSLMLGEFTRVFNVDGALESGQAGAEDTTESGDMSRRNSKHYSDAAADQLLGLSGRTLTAEESQSEEELSIHDESGTEGTDNAEVDSVMEASTMSSSVYSAMRQSGYDADVNVLSPQSSRGRASDVAASRGLNISVADKASRRHSRMVGLPHSPRPPQSDASPSPRPGASPVAPSPHTPK